MKHGIKPGPTAARSQDFLYDDDGLPPVIAVDTSALMAILLDEPVAANCADALASQPPRLWFRRRRLPKH